jgi:ribosomal protein S25
MTSIVDVKNYIKKNKIVNSYKIADDLNITMENLEPFLLLLENKKIIQPANKDKINCGQSCGKCAIKSAVLYRWMAD